MDSSEAPPTKKPRPHFPKKVKKACANCRRAHSRCDDKRPCSRCVAHLIPHTCDVDSSMVVRNTVSDPVVYAPSLQPSPQNFTTSIKRNDEESRRSDPRAISWWNLRGADQLCLVQCSSKFAEEVLGCTPDLIVNRLLLQDLFVNNDTVTLITSRLDYNIRFGPVEALWNTANGQTKTVLFWCNCKVVSFGSPFDLELGVFNVTEGNNAPIHPLPSLQSLSQSSSTPPRSPQSRSPPSRSPQSRSPPSRSPPRAAHAHPQPLSPQPPVQAQPISLFSRPPNSSPNLATPNLGAPISLFSNPPNRLSAFSSISPPGSIQSGANMRPFNPGQPLTNLPPSSSSSLHGLSALSESAISELAMLSISQQKSIHHPHQLQFHHHQPNSAFSPSDSPSPPFVLSAHPLPSTGHSNLNSEPPGPTKKENVGHRSSIHSLLN